MTATDNPLDMLVASLTAADASVMPASAIEGLLRNADLDDASLRPYLHFGTAGYTRTCVHRDNRFELLVLCWSAGAQSPIHDHGESRCFVKIVRGSLTVDDYAIVAGGRAPGFARIVHSRRALLRAGDIDARQPMHDVHRVEAAAGNAISLHVYAQPLDRCLVFDLPGQSCRFAANYYDTRPPVRAIHEVVSK